MTNFRRLGLAILATMTIALVAGPAHAAGPTIAVHGTAQSPEVAGSGSANGDGESVTVCKTERLSFVKPDGARLTQMEIATGTKVLIVCTVG